MVVKTSFNHIFTGLKAAPAILFSLGLQNKVHIVQ